MAPRKGSGGHNGGGAGQRSWGPCAGTRRREHGREARKSSDARASRVSCFPLQFEANALYTVCN